MTDNRADLRRRRSDIWHGWQLAFVSALLIAALALLGWAGTDRLEWASRARQIDVDTESIHQIRDVALPQLRERIAAIPIENVTRKEHEDLQEIIRAQLLDVRQEITSQRQGTERLQQTVDNLMISLAKLRASVDLMEDGAPGAHAGGDPPKR